MFWTCGAALKEFHRRTHRIHGDFDFDNVLVKRGADEWRSWISRHPEYSAFRRYNQESPYRDIATFVLFVRASIRRSCSIWRSGRSCELARSFHGRLFPGCARRVRPIPARTPHGRAAAKHLSWPDIQRSLYAAEPAVRTDDLTPGL